MRREAVEMRLERRVKQEIAWLHAMAAGVARLLIAARQYQANMRARMAVAREHMASGPSLQTVFGYRVSYHHRSPSCPTIMTTGSGRQRCEAFTRFKGHPGRAN